MDQFKPLTQRVESAARAVVVRKRARMMLEILSVAMKAKEGRRIVLKRPLRAAEKPAREVLTLKRAPPISHICGCRFEADRSPSRAGDSERIRVVSTRPVGSE